MGRHSTGALHTKDCRQLQVKEFTHHIKDNLTHTLTAEIAWKSGACITVKLSPTSFGANLQLMYNKVDEDKEHPIDYTVSIVGTPSNLGKGKVYHFVCPFSGKKVKTLYMAYGSHYFKSMAAYKHRIYYASQMGSKLDRHNDTYWRLEGRIDRLYKQHPKEHYKGKSTKARQRIERMEERKTYHDEMRWFILPVALSKHMAALGCTDVHQLYR